jgi:hypothetical protein
LGEGCIAAELLVKIGKARVFYPWPLAYSLLVCLERRDPLIDASQSNRRPEVSPPSMLGGRCRDAVVTWVWTDVTTT